MVSALFHAVFYNPIYNILVLFIAVSPAGDVGLAVVALTIVVRLILLPFSLSAARSQRQMRALEPRINEIKELYKDQKDVQAVKTMEAYKEAKVNPFASILPVFIQIPMLLALYWVFRFEPFTTLDAARLYAITPIPSVVSNSLFGIVAMNGKSIVLAILAGVAQYFQATVALSNAPTPSGSGMQADFSRAMTMQMRFVFPIMIIAIAYTTSAAIALYFCTSNLAGVVQEWYVRRTLGKVA